MIRIGILGAGGNTRDRHIPGLQAIEGVHIDAVCNRSLESSQRVCDAFGIPRAVDDPKAILGDPAIDAVVIGTWPYKHAEFTIAALEQGKHVMCEARMAMDANEAERMLRVSRQHPDRVAQIVPAPFTLHYDRIVRELVDQRLGQLLSVRLKLHNPGFPDTDAGTAVTWRRDRALSGNNIMAVGIHYETLMRWVGPVRELSARTRTIAAGGDVPDHVLISGSLARDDATFLMSATAAAGAFDTGQEVWLHGQQGAVHIDLNRHVVRFGEPGQEQMETVDIASHALPGWRVEEEFISAIRGEEPIRLTDFATGVAYMRFTDAIHTSTAEQRHVAITPVEP